MSGYRRTMEPTVRNNDEAHRYELVIDDQVVGVADYRLQGDVLVVPHTEIAGHLQGRGLGAVLVQGMLDDVRANGRKVVPRCWYVAQHMRDHPETADLLATAS